MEKQAVLDLLNVSTEPLSAAQIAEKTGLERKVVDKVMKSLKEDGVITSPRRCFWEAIK